MVTEVFNADGSLKRLRQFCLDIDTCGKTGGEIAAAIGKSLAQFERFHNARCISIEGDSGGGGAVMNVHRELVQMERLWFGRDTSAVSYML